jgi:hypothetical protein
LDPDLNILDYLQGWQPLVLLQIPALAPLGDFDDDLTQALRQH